MQKNICLIDLIAAHQEPAYVVFENEHFIAFLDHRPLFPGHVLLSPKLHIPTLDDLPDTLVEPLFILTRRLSRAVVEATQSEGSFIAMNNKVSQSIPHLHVHIVPRNKGDGLKGFFWPRIKYSNEQHCQEIQNQIIACLN